MEFLGRDKMWPVQNSYIRWRKIHHKTLLNVDVYQIRPSYDNKIKKYGRSVVCVPELRNGQNIFVEKTDENKTVL